MTAALEGGEWSAARPGRTLPPEKTQYPFYRRLGGPQNRSGRAENLVPTGIRSPTVQPVVSRLSLQLPQLKQPVTETGQSQEFQDSLSREYPGLVHSALRAQSPIYSFSQFCCLLVLTALTPVSNTVLHRCTTPLTLNYAVPQSQPRSLCKVCKTNYPLRATRCLAVTRLSTSCYPLDLHNAYCTSRKNFALLVSAGYH